MTFDEAVAVITAPGMPFEIVEQEVLGRPSRVFAQLPPNLRSLFDMIRARPADDVFIIYEDERWTNADILRSIDGIAKVLVEEYGVQPGDRVAIDMRNYPEWMTSFGAITSIGAIAVSVNAWWTGPEIEFGLVDSGAKVMIADRERTDRIWRRLPDLGVQVIVVRSEGALHENCAHLGDLLDESATMPEVSVDPDADATILFTSGTTGTPKGAVSTQRAVLSGLFSFACRNVVESLRWAPDTPPPAGPEGAVPSSPAFILTVPLFHVTGCVPVMLGAVATGARIVMMRKWDPLRALELIEREKVTNFIGVPTMSQDLISHPRFAEFDTSSLKNVGGGGAPMAPELVRKIDGSFTKATPQLGYGLTETNGYGPGNTGPDYVSHPTSTGRVVPIMQIKVVNPNNEVLPNGEVGEICMSGPMLIRGYWHRPEATAEAILDGWLHTGDLGYVDDEGFVYVVDRIKDMVLRGGENVYCSEVEAAIFEHPHVHEVAVFGLPHERLGEEVACALQPTEGASIDTTELTEFLASRIAPFKIPTQWFVRDEPLPRGATGKILKREIRDRVLDGTF